jgi:transcriptional regulator with XRE-family HTH domain
VQTVQQRFGAHVRQLRKARGWSQEELAHRTGRHWTYIGGVERGERNPTLRVIADLAKALEVPIRKPLPDDGR